MHLIFSALKQLFNLSQMKILTLSSKFVKLTFCNKFSFQDAASGLAYEMTKNTCMVILGRYLVFPFVQKIKQDELAINFESGNNSSLTLIILSI